MSTPIEWTDETWNPVTGCDRTSPGCDHCYALKMAARLKGMGQANYQTDGDPRTSGPGFGVTCHPHMLDKPLRWKKPRRIFVNSMSDLFHPDVPDEFIGDVWNTMALAPQHTFQILTKRARRMHDLLQRWEEAGRMWRRTDLLWCGPPQVWPLPNVWLGVSIESDRYTFRADHLRATPAAVRFISAEPLLGPLPSLDLTGIDWLIVGGESGPGARPMHPDWARDLRDRSRRADVADDDVPRDECGARVPVAFLFKQWGAWAPIEGDGIEFGRWVDPTTGGTHAVPMEGGALMSHFGKHAAGRELDGTWDEYPAAVVA